MYNYIQIDKKNRSTVIMMYLTFRVMPLIYALAISSLCD